MGRHLQERHRSWETTSSPREVASSRDTILISNEEETKLGIPEHQVHGHVVAREAYDNCRMQSPPSICDNHGNSPHRTRRPATACQPLPICHSYHSCYNTKAFLPCRWPFQLPMSFANADQSILLLYCCRLYPIL